MIVLIAGYGSISKQHADALLKLGERSIDYTQYPDNKADIQLIIWRSSIITLQKTRQIFLWQQFHILYHSPTVY